MFVYTQVWFSSKPDFISNYLVKFLAKQSKNPSLFEDMMNTGGKPILIKKLWNYFYSNDNILPLNTMSSRKDVSSANDRSCAVKRKTAFALERHLGHPRVMFDPGIFSSYDSISLGSTTHFKENSQIERRSSIIT